MTAPERQALKAAVDARRREIAGKPRGCEISSRKGYRNGCRCYGCREAAADNKRAWRDRHALACIDCGKPVKSTKHPDRPRCILCFNRARHLAGALA